MTRARYTFAILAAAAALALPAAALAAPTAPLLHPVPSQVTVWPGASTLTVAWDPSLLDPGAHAGLYQVMVVAGTSSSTHYASCCSYSVQLVPGYHYVVWVRASEWTGCSIVCSLSWSQWRAVQFDTVSIPVIDITP